ncbi:chitin biosynthesis protein CHS5 [Nannizzia gypsea CBS 118893]|uniref:Chitin biosynthesis protein CHS5 n=1 Tax=Arthroderma gypseum (strain ATCC MYA-4604 / CBS 118893) TaxID=535722 RepID=E5R0C1_ARTGP|nr:chitin biosynthesis protein CHS5 [Nannizzia gypsea CBS 118893]EFQ98317.1 chitin biosynthesis protein CHS5 [Nannizzia gypsea CBS 118893]
MLVSLTVGKVDAGVAVLLTEDNRLIEFPSVLLPRNITSGSIVDITVSPNEAAEAADQAASKALQDKILNTYGINTPSPPELRLKNATQTSVVLEWDPIQLATASLKSLSLYRNGSKAGSIPRPLEMLSTKISGLAIDTEYTFQLILRTSAGMFSSEKLVCRTHKMTDLSGITVTAGILPDNLRESLANAVDRIGGKLIDTVRIDTTHFVCTEGRGPAWEKAVEMNIPVVRPEWVEGCEREGTIVSVRGYYLNADPKLRQIGPGVGAQQNKKNSILSLPTHGRQNSMATSRSSPENNQNPPVTPFPGGPRSEVPNGLRPEGGSPPPPPPKGDNNGSSKDLPSPPVSKDDNEEEENGKDNETREKNHIASDDDAATNDEDDRKPTNGQLHEKSPASRPASDDTRDDTELQSPAPDAEASKESGSGKNTKGASTDEAEMEEVTL